MVKNTYNYLFKTIKTIVIEFDIVGLVEQGAPEDEYDYEIVKIIVAMSKCKDVKSLQKHIYDIFKDNFGSSSARNLNEYFELATRIWMLKNEDIAI